MGPRRGLRGSWGSRESVATKAGAATGNGGAPVGSIRLCTCKTQDTNHAYVYHNGVAEQADASLPSRHVYTPTDLWLNCRMETQR